MLEKIQKWNLQDKRTLHYYPSSGILHTDEIFQSLKKGYIRQIHDRLSFLKTREQERRSGVFGLTIEYMFRNLARKAGARKEVHYGIATYIDHSFPPDQKKKLFCLLHDIEESIPWKGLDFSRARDEYGKNRA